MVLIEDLATRAVTPYLFFVRTRGSSAGAKEFGWLEFFKGMSLVMRAYLAVLPADLPVLFRIFRNIFGRIDHNSRKCAVMDYRFSCRISPQPLVAERAPFPGFSRTIVALSSADISVILSAYRCSG